MRYAIQGVERRILDALDEGTVLRAAVRTPTWTDGDRLLKLARLLRQREEALRWLAYAEDLPSGLTEVAGPESRYTGM